MKVLESGNIELAEGEAAIINVMCNWHCQCNMRATSLHLDIQSELDGLLSKLQKQYNNEPISSRANKELP